MSEKSKEIAAWQERFYKMPCVYWVEQADPHGYGHPNNYGCTGNYYQTIEGAKKELAWIESRGKRAKIVNVHLHSDALSTERWLLE